MVIHTFVRWGFIFLAATSTVLTESLVLVRATPVVWLPLGAMGVMLGWWGLREDGW